MVNYGFECKDWSADKKERLASELAKRLKPYDKLKPSPTIEVDETYLGVRMRKLTWIPEPELDELITKADEVFHKIAKERGEQ